METEGLLVAAQDQTLRINWIKNQIDRDGTQSPWSLCFIKIKLLTMYSVGVQNY